MKNRWRIAIGIALGAVVAAGVALAVLWPREPAYQGKFLSVWLDQLGPRYVPRPVREAFEAMGISAVPILLDKVRSRDSFYERTYRRIWVRLPGSFQRRIPPPTRTGYTFHLRIALALSSIGPPATPPLLVGLDDPNPEVRFVSVSALGQLGSKANVRVQSLSKLLNDPDFQVRMAALSAIDQMGSQRREVIPELVRELNQRSPARVKELIAATLGGIGPEATLAVPALRNLLSARNEELRARAAMALWRIVGDTNMITSLISELEESSDVRFSALLVTDLGEIGSPAKKAIPTILDKLREHSRYQRRPPGGVDFRQTVKVALERIDPDTAHAFNNDTIQGFDLKAARLGDEADTK